MSGWLPAYGTPMGEAARAALVLAVFYALVVAVEIWHRRAHPPIEWTRKMVHFGTGLLACAFPWWFDSPWTLLAVAAVGGAPIFVARARGGLQSIFGVERRSFGDVYFPIAIFILFAVGRHTRVFYVVALLTLVVADALAAVLGRAYGKHAYRVTTEHRSLEGSVVFMIVTFLVVHLPLLLATQIDRSACVLMAFQIALLVGSFEAIGTQGSDNLFVPLGAYYLPDQPAGFFPDDHTHVNTFRGILSAYFGADLPALPDRSYDWPDNDHIYDFIDVTDRLPLPGGANGPDGVDLPPMEGPGSSPVPGTDLSLDGDE